MICGVDQPAWGYAFDPQPSDVGIACDTGRASQIDFKFERICNYNRP